MTLASTSKEDDPKRSSLFLSSYHSISPYLTPSNPYFSIPATTLILLSSYKLHRNFIKRIPNAQSLTPSTLGGKSLRGYVTSVGDADNFRIYHTPLLLRWRTIPVGKALKDQTIHVRLAGVDAPELAHFGKPAQPFSSEALDWLTKYVHHKRVKVELYDVDRYGRAVGMAYIRKFPYLFQKNVSEEMLRAGFATVYTSGGAVHAGLLAKFERVEAKAKSQKKGMWAQSSREYESPAEYKKRTAGSSSSPGSVT